MSAEPRESPSPSEYRAENPYKPPPPEYKPPSMLAEHRGLAILFLAVLLGCVAFGWHALRHGPARRASAAAAQPANRPQPASAQEPAGAEQPIYIQAIPGKDSR
jgi:hypothetical protein